MYYPSNINREQAAQQRDKQLAGYRTLSAAQQVLVQLLSIIFGEVPVRRLLIAVQHLEFGDDHGNTYTQATLASHLAELEQRQLIVRREQCVAIHDLFAELATRAAVRENRFAKLAPVVPVLRDLHLEEQKRRGYGPIAGFDGQRVLCDLRLALYGHDYAQLSAKMGLTHNRLSYVDQSLMSVCDNPFDIAWVRSLPPLIGAEVLRPFLQQAHAGLQPAPEPFALLEALCRERSIDDWSGYPAFWAQCLLLRGRFDEAADALSQAHGWEVTCARAWLAVVRGQYDDALDLYSQSLKQLRRTSGTNTVYFNNQAGWFHIPLLVKKGDPRSLKDAARYIQMTTYNKAFSELHHAFHILVESQREVSQVRNLNPDLDANDPGLSDCVYALCLYWMLPERVADHIDALRTIHDRAQQAGYVWIQAEMAALLQRLGPADAPPYQPPAGMVPMVELMTSVPAWQRSLEALLALGQRDETDRDAQAMASDSRLVWLIRHYKDDCSFKPVQQTLSMRGWSKGKPVPLKTLVEQADALDFLTAQDVAICAHLVPRKSGRGFSTGNPTYQFNRRDALRAMIGHPYLFWDRSPDKQVALDQGEPELRITRTDSGVQLQFVPWPIHEKAYLVCKINPTLLKFFEFNPVQERIADLVGPGLTIPQSGHNQLLDVIEAVSEQVVVNSDLERGSDTAVEADSRPHVQLVEFGSGLKLTVMVRPFADVGPYFRPGVGGTTVFANVGDETRVATRDLAREQQRFEAVLAQCPTLASIEDNQGEWHLETPEDCLEVLLELQALGDEIVTEWPEGATLSVRRVSQNNMRLAIHSGTDWFHATGDVDLGDGTAVAVRDLMAQLKVATGRFVPLGEGRFVTLTRAFRKRLQELQALTEQRSNQLRFSPLAAPVMADLIRGLAHVETDEDWQTSLARFDTAYEQVFTVPETLRAELRDYQREGFVWLSRLAHWGAGACLADDMGLGKTVQALAFLLTKAHEGPCLIVAPTSVCANWMAEARRFAPGLRCISLATGNRQQIIGDLKPFDMVVCSYGILQNEAALLARPRWVAVVLDEAQAIKNAATKRSKAAMALRADFKMITTGTPIENHLGELWNLFRFINPGLLGSWQSFSRRFVVMIERYHSEVARSALKKLIQPFILRRLKSHVLEELPPRTEITLHVELSRKEQIFYEAVRQQALENLSQAADGDGSAAGPRHLQILAEIMRMRRACCHPRLVLPDSPLPGSKLALFGEVLDELLANQHKALVFSQFVDHLRIIRAHLDEKGITYQYLDGSTPARERKKRVDNFQSGIGDVFLISLKAGGTGLNLTAADYVIHMDPWWNPAVEDQASDRAYRIGQTRPVTIYRLISKDTIEEQIAALHAHKRDLAASLLTDSDSTGKLSAEELLALIRNEAPPGG